MRPGERYPGGPELADTQGVAPPARHLERRAGQEDRGMRPAARRWWAAAAWACGGLALFAYFEAYPKLSLKKYSPTAAR